MSNTARIGEIRARLRAVADERRELCLRLPDDECSLRLSGLADEREHLLAERDAFSPPILRERVKRAIVRHLDVDAWDHAEVVERAERNSLTSILSAWPGISGQASE